MLFSGGRKDHALEVVCRRKELLVCLSEPERRSWCIQHSQITQSLAEHISYCPSLKSCCRTSLVRQTSPPGVLNSRRALRSTQLLSLSLDSKGVGFPCSCGPCRLEYLTIPAPIGPRSAHRSSENRAPPSTFACINSALLEFPRAFSFYGLCGATPYKT